MAGSVNKVILVGNLGKDPESAQLRQWRQGGQLLGRHVGKLEGPQLGRAQGKDRVAQCLDLLRRPRRVAESYLKKGSKVYLEGQLETRKWQDQSGNDRYSTDVVLRQFNSAMVLLDARGEGGGGGYGGGGGSSYGGGGDDFGGGGGGSRPQSAPAARGVRHRPRR